MDAKTYFTTFDRTLTGDFHGANVHPDQFDDVVARRLEMNNMIDAMKKSLFYNKKVDYLLPAGRLAKEWEDYDPNFLHAVLGIDTESAELLELLRASPIMDAPSLKKKIQDEAGDLLWYVALLLKTAGIDFEQAFEKNIAKLKARYPEGFSQEAAVHRDEAKESAVFH